MLRIQEYFIEKKHFTLVVKNKLWDKPAKLQFLDCVDPLGGVVMTKRRVISKIAYAGELTMCTTPLG